MTISETVRALLVMRGKKQVDLINVLGASSKQSLNNKFSLDRWDGKDLLKVADALSCRLAFVLPNSDLLYFDPDPYLTTEEVKEAP